jgi:hypothetical protein
MHFLSATNGWVWLFNPVPATVQLQLWSWVLELQITTQTQGCARQQWHSLLSEESI